MYWYFFKKRPPEMKIINKTIGYKIAKWMYELNKEWMMK